MTSAASARATIPGRARAWAALLLAVGSLLPMAVGAQVVANPALNPAISAEFSPGSAEALVLQTIDSARHSLRMAAYEFTSTRVARALVEAHQRGVDVRVLVDRRANLEEGWAHARRALSMLQRAQIPLRAVDAYPVFHDKYQVIDARTVQTGSFNYTPSAAHRNAENVLVVWNSPELAQRYLQDWSRQWALGQEPAQIAP